MIDTVYLQFHRIISISLMMHLISAIFEIFLNFTTFITLANICNGIPRGTFSTYTIFVCFLIFKFFVFSYFVDIFAGLQFWLELYFLPSNMHLQLYEICYINVFYSFIPVIILNIFRFKSFVLFGTYTLFHGS